MSSVLVPRSAAALLGAFAAVLNGVLRVAIVPLFVTPLFDQVLNLQDASALPRVLAVAAVVAIGGSLALWAQDALLGRAAAQVGSQLRNRLYSHLLSQPPGRLPGTSGGLASRIINDLKEVETFFRYGVGTLIAESVTLTLIVVLLVRADARAALALLALTIPTVLVLRWVGGYLQRVADRSMAQSEEVGRNLQEGLKHHELVRAFGASSYMLQRFQPANKAVERALSQRSLIAGLQVPITQVLVFAAIGVLVTFLVAGVGRGVMTVGDVIAFVTLVALAATPTQLLPHGYSMYRQAAAAARRLEELEAEACEPGPQVTDEAIYSGRGLPAPMTFTVSKGLSGADASMEHSRHSHMADGAISSEAGLGSEPALIELTDVSYEYRSGVPVLQDVSFSLPTKGLVVVSGASGSGKTTLLRLLLRFDQPTSGELLLSGKPLPDVPEATLRAALAYVPQDHGIISGELTDVLAMGRNINAGGIWAALKSVGLESAVRAMPAGLESELGEDGEGLSGGQRQRLAVARALLGSPAALLLDEPTSNLDDASEHEIVTLLVSLAKERLVLAVTHRPALAEVADMVLTATPITTQRAQSARS